MREFDECTLFAFIQRFPRASEADSGYRRNVKQFVDRWTQCRQSHIETIRYLHHSQQLFVKLLNLLL